MADRFIVFDDVHKTYDGRAVIDGVSLQLSGGQTIALCGGNGAGKSTLLRMLVGSVHPTRGAITVGGRSWRDDRRAYAAQIGYMPDDYRFSPGLTAWETMLFWAKLRRVESIRAKEVLQMVGLDDTGSKPVSAFSKGMRQRVLFAQALLAKPPLLVMDEPTNGLDPYWMETFMRLVREAAAAGQTVVFSTHQLQIATALSDQIVMLQDGRTVLHTAKQPGAHAVGRFDEEELQQMFGRLFGMTDKERH